LPSCIIGLLAFRRSFGISRGNCNFALGGSQFGSLSPLGVVNDSLLPVVTGNRFSLRIVLCLSEVDGPEVLGLP